jgi:hypothetical protein
MEVACEKLAGLSMLGAVKREDCSKVDQIEANSCKVLMTGCSVAYQHCIYPMLCMSCTLTTMLLVHLIPDSLLSQRVVTELEDRQSCLVLNRVYTVTPHILYSLSGHIMFGM